MEINISPPTRGWKFLSPNALFATKQNLREIYIYIYIYIYVPHQTLHLPHQILHLYQILHLHYITLSNVPSLNIF